MSAPQKQIVIPHLMRYLLHLDTMSDRSFSLNAAKNQTDSASSAERRFIFGVLMISVSQKSIVLSRSQHVRTLKANCHTALDAVSVVSWHDVRRELLFKMLLKTKQIPHRGAV